MRELGFAQFQLVGHDRGARVSHRLTLDHPEAVTRLAVLDIVPTRHIWHNVTRDMDLPEVQASHRLEATVPLGDGEFLGRLRERTTGAVVRPAGSTLLLDATIPPQRLPSP